jgi:hypothetical protein
METGPLPEKGTPQSSVGGHHLQAAAARELDEQRRNALAEVDNAGFALVFISNPMVSLSSLFFELQMVPRQGLHGGWRRLLHGCVSDP